MSDREEKRRLKLEIKERKEAEARKKADLMEHKKALKEDAPYLNSFPRVVKCLIWSVVEFVLVFIILSVMTNYIRTGTFNLDTLPDTIIQYMKPGSVLFTAIISFLPILVLENIGAYFGQGSVPRMVIGIVKILAIRVWFNFVVAAAGDIDIIKMSGMQGSDALQGLEAFTVNVSPFVKLVDIILILSCIIPIGEFIGSRKKHSAAVINHEAHKARVQADKDEIAAAKEARKQAKVDAKAARRHKDSKDQPSDEDEEDISGKRD